MSHHKKSSKNKSMSNQELKEAIGVILDLDINSDIVLESESDTLGARGRSRHFNDQSSHPFSHRPRRKSKSRSHVSAYDAKMQ